MDKKIMILALTILGVTALLTPLVLTMIGRSEYLKSVEVKKYEGQDLSSITEFRENSIKGPQEVNVSEYELRIDGLANNPINFSYEEVLGFDSYKKVVTLYCVEGWDATTVWEGVLVEELIDAAEPSPNATIAIFHAVEGYTSSLPIDYLRSNDILLAYRVNNVTLPVENGFPFQLVAESKWGYKWVRWVERIELSSDEDYEGYWESRGYSGTGDLNETFID